MLPVSDPTSVRLRSRGIVVGLAALIPVIPIVIALTLGSGGGARASLTTAASPFRAVSPPSRGPTLPNQRLPPGTGSLVARLEHRAVLRISPGGRPYARLATSTEFGSPQALAVVRQAGRWLGVLSPQAGNGRVGWIAARDASLSRVDWEIRVSLSRRQLVVRRGGAVRRRYTVAVGAPGAPTPTGHFAVTDRLSTGDPGGPYGCCVLALSAKSPHAIQGWSGGDRIAIHSTTDSASIGHDVSHGCLRLTLAEGRWLLAHIPVGTPVLING